MAKSKKEKKEKTSTDKPLTRRYSAGGVVFKRVEDFVVWLIIRPRGTDRWQLPKGAIDKGETGRDAGVREVAEEGGVKAKILKKVGNESYFYYIEGERIFQHVTFYLMEFIEETGEGFDKKEIDEVKFFSFEEAWQNLTYENDKKLLVAANKFLESGLQENLL